MAREKLTAVISSTTLRPVGSEAEFIAWINLLAGRLELFVRVATDDLYGAMATLLWATNASCWEDLKTRTLRLEHDPDTKELIAVTDAFEKEWRDVS